MLACTAVLSMAGCQNGQSRSAAFPLAEVAQFNQPVPLQAVLGQPFMASRDVLPQARAVQAQSLPAAVALPHAPALPQMLQQAQTRSDVVQAKVLQALSVQGSGWAGQLAL